MVNKAIIRFVDGSEEEINEWSKLNVESTYVMFVFNKMVNCERGGMASVKMDTVKSVIVPYNNIAHIEILTE